MENDKDISAVFRESAESISQPNTPSGPANGKVNQLLVYTSGNSTSNLGHEIEYRFDWGDGNLSEWGPTTQNYKYAVVDTYLVKAQARCKAHNGITSNWSGGTAVQISGHNLIVSVDPDGSGIIKKNPDKLEYNHNEPVELIAMNNEGYLFDHWGGAISGHQSTNSIIMNDDKNVLAVFTLSPVDLDTSEISLLDSISVNKGENFELPLYITSLDSISIAQFVFEYDNTIIKFVSSRLGSNSDNLLISTVNLNLPFNPTSQFMNENLLIQIYGDITNYVHGVLQHVLTLTFQAVGNYGDSCKIIIDQNLEHTNLTSINAKMLPIFFKSDCKVTIKNISHIFTEDSDNQKISQFMLYQNYPNPFNPDTQITFNLPTPEIVNLTIYDMVGRKVRSLIFNQSMSAGGKTVRWDGMDVNLNPVSAGVYILAMKAGDFKKTIKMLYLK